MIRSISFRLFLFIILLRLQTYVCLLGIYNTTIKGGCQGYGERVSGVNSVKMAFFILKLTKFSYLEFMLQKKLIADAFEAYCVGVVSYD